MATDPFFGWGIERPESGTDKPFLLCRLYWSREEACSEILATYGAKPNREAALRRHRRAGIRAVRVCLARADSVILDPPRDLEGA